MAYKRSKSNDGSISGGQWRYQTWDHTDWEEFQKYNNIEVSYINPSPVKKERAEKRDKLREEYARHRIITRNLCKDMPYTKIKCCNKKCKNVFRQNTEYLIKEKLVKLYCSKCGHTTVFDTEKLLKQYVDYMYSHHIKMNPYA